MLRYAVLFLALFCVVPACQVEEPPADPVEDSAPSTPPVRVEPPPVAENDPVEPAAPPSEGPAAPPVVEEAAEEKAAETDPPPAPEPAEAGMTEARRKLLVDQLKAPKAGERFAAAIELGKTGNADCVGPLATTLKEDKDYFVKRAAARSLGELGFEEAVPALIDALSDSEEFVTISARQALERISGTKFETAAEWSAWWAKKK